MWYLLDIYYVDGIKQDLKVGDLISFNYFEHKKEILAIILDILIFPEGDPDFISYLYIYAIREDVHVFALYEEIKNLEVLWNLFPKTDISW